MLLELMPLFMVLFVGLMLMGGYPVAFTLAGASLLFVGIGMFTGTFNEVAILGEIPGKIFDIHLSKAMLMTVPLFVFMGVMLERSRLAEDLLDAISRLFGNLRGGLAIGVIAVGMVLGASTAIVGATVVTLGLLAVPAMLKRRYSPSLASGVVTASGTLGQIIPPSIVLILLADQLTNAVTAANTAPPAAVENGIETEVEAAPVVFDEFAASDDFAAIDDFSDDYFESFESESDSEFAGDVSTEASADDQFATGMLSQIDNVSVQDLFAGAMLPALLLVSLYALYIMVTAWLKPAMAPAPNKNEFGSISWWQFTSALLPPVILIVIILGSIISGWGTLTAAAAFGAIGATVIATVKKRLTWAELYAVALQTVKITSMVFMILIAAQFFAQIFRGFGGDAMLEAALLEIPGGAFGAMLAVMILLLVLGFMLDFFEITFIVVPLVGPILLGMGIDPIWLGVMIAMNLQTSFLTPPFGFALFYYRGVAPPEVRTMDIYRGVLPFIGIQIFMLMVLAVFPDLVTWLPRQFGSY